MPQSTFRCPRCGRLLQKGGAPVRTIQRLYCEPCGIQAVGSNLLEAHNRICDPNSGRAPKVVYVLGAHEVDVRDFSKVNSIAWTRIRRVILPHGHLGLRDLKIYVLRGALSALPQPACHSFDVYAQTHGLRLHYVRDIQKPLSQRPE